MSDTGYTTRPVGSLSIADLLAEALQAGHSAGFYAGVLERGGTWSEYEPLLIEARDRRNECFNEIQRRLEAAEALAETLKTFAQHPYLYGGARVAADTTEVYCKLCNAIGEGTLWDIKHADTCPIGKGLAALAEWVEANR